jgi:hypothetical protein
MARSYSGKAFPAEDKQKDTIAENGSIKISYMLP